MNRQGAVDGAGYEDWIPPGDNGDSLRAADDACSDLVVGVWPRRPTAGAVRSNLPARHDRYKLRTVC